jgi:hypothetical protein
LIVVVVVVVVVVLFEIVVLFSPKLKLKYLIEKNKNKLKTFLLVGFFRFVGT